jgi:transcriptional regulator with XRE-family HTH domain
VTKEQAFGTVLRRLRTEKGISQEKLAEISDLHRTYISQLERGLKSPSLSAIFKLALALGVSPHTVVFLTEKELLREPSSSDDEDHL